MKNLVHTLVASWDQLTPLTDKFDNENPTRKRSSNKAGIINNWEKLSMIYITNNALDTISKP